MLAIKGAPLMAGRFRVPMPEIASKDRAPSQLLRFATVPRCGGRNRAPVGASLLAINARGAYDAACDSRGSSGRRA